MALPDKVEAVKKVSEALNKQQPITPTEQMERAAPNNEHFQALMNSTQPLQNNFQHPDGSSINVDSIHKEANPIFAEDNVKVQANGSATDQENKKRKQAPTEEVEGVASTKDKKSSSLMDEVKKLNTKVTQATHLSPESLRAQAKDVIAQIDTVKTQLSQTPPGDLKSSYQNLLRNRLTHIDDNLKIALSKAGVEYTPSPQVAGPGKGATNPIERFVGFLTHSQYQLEHLSQTIDELNLSKVQLTPATMLALQIKVGYVQQQIELFTSLLNKALESTKTIMNVQV